MNAKKVCFYQIETKYMCCMEQRNNLHFYIAETMKFNKFVSAQK